LDTGTKWQYNFKTGNHALQKSDKSEIHIFIKGRKIEGPESNKEDKRFYIRAFNFTVGWIYGTKRKTEF